jgi:hypothetical protein
MLLEHTDPHVVLAPGYAHPATLTPSQEPAQVELDAAQAVRRPCGAPTTGEHVPCAPTTLHAWHSPPQAALQQNPSTQMLLTHSDCRVQEAPLACTGKQLPERQ